MKVKDLIEELEALDPDALVILSSDAEGNRYSEIDTIYEGGWDEKNEEPVDEDEDGGVAAVIFYPQ